MAQEISFCRFETRGAVVDVRDETHLKNLLRRLESSNEPSARIVHVSGDDLFMAVRGNVACAVFHKSTMDPPYFSASMGHPKPDEYFEFYVGGTPTEMPLDRCIPVEVMELVLVEFARTGQLSDLVNWIPD